MFFKQVAALGGQHRVLAVTYPGEPDPLRLAHGLAALLERVEAGDCLIAGSSFASYWLQFFAEFHPDRFGRLLLGNGFVEGSPLREHPLFAPTLIGRSPAAVQGAWRERTGAMPPSELRDIQMDMLSGRQAAAVLHARLVSVIDGPRPPDRRTTDERITLLDCVDDAIITAAMRDDLSARYPRAKRYTLERGGHYPHILNPDAYNAVLRESVT